jgi:transcriptional regulator
MATYKRWRDVRKKKLSPEVLAEVERAVARELIEMDLREMREASGKTQEEVAAALEATQSEVSRLERRVDHRLSTLRRVVEALGGELEIIANFGDRRVRLRATG